MSDAATITDELLRTNDIDHVLKDVLTGWKQQGLRANEAKAAIAYSSTIVGVHQGYTREYLQFRMEAAFDLVDVYWQEVH